MAKETVIRQITMVDGSVRGFPEKRKVLKEVTAVMGDDGKPIVKATLAWDNGQFTYFTMPETLVLEFLKHGVAQKLGDASAGIELTDDAQLATEQLVDGLYEGRWSQRSDGGMAGASLLARALIEISNGSLTPEQVRKFLSERTKAEQSALSRSAKVAPVYTRLQQERAAKKVSKGTALDGDALLGDLLGA